MFTKPLTIPYGDKKLIEIQQRNVSQPAAVLELNFLKDNVHVKINDDNNLKII